MKIIHYSPKKLHHDPVNKICQTRRPNEKLHQIVAKVKNFYYLWSRGAQDSKISGRDAGHYPQLLTVVSIGL